MMKVFTWSMGNDVVARYVVTTDKPVNPTEENYRFDINYNELVRDPEFCAVDYYDTDEGYWSALAGTPADVYLYNLVSQDPDFKGFDYLYYTLQADNIATMEPKNDMVDVTPNKGETHVPRIT